MWESGTPKHVAALQHSDAVLVCWPLFQKVSSSSFSGFWFSISALHDPSGISHIPLWWFVCRISPLYSIWSIVPVSSRSWSRFHQAWEFFWFHLKWSWLHYYGFTFLHFCFLWGSSGTRDCLLLRCSIKICNQVEFTLKNLPASQSLCAWFWSLLRITCS